MNILVFAGTSEGRRLCEFLSEHNFTATACVATEYGNEIMPNLSGITVKMGRLDIQQMEQLMIDFDLVIDATHPYANVVTENIKTATQNANRKYIRLLRPKIESKGTINVDTTEQAAEFLKSTEGKVLLTTGSKELEKFINIPDYQNRLCPRVLPSVEVIQKCYELGFRGENLICMQGPFSYQMNIELIKKLNIKYLVTKDTGRAGGFDEKIMAAEDLGIKTILIARPKSDDNGFSFDEVINYLKGNNKPHKFPMFINLQNQKVVVVGAGNIATRRIKTLMQFGADITVIAPNIKERFNSIKYIQREFKEGDLSGAFIAVSATDSREVNHRVYLEAQKHNIPVSIADNREECTYFFPAVCMNDKIVTGIVSKGNDHHLTVDTAKKIREILGD